jgi:hypothetical protein
VNALAEEIAALVIAAKGDDRLKWYGGTKVKVLIGEIFPAGSAVREAKVLSRVGGHSPRGDELINYTEFGDLASIVGQNWSHFEDHLQSQDWVRQIISTVERSRNVIMHSGELGLQDVERIGTAIRDWIRQVGA